MNYQKLFCCISITFLAGCSSQAHAPKALADVIVERLGDNANGLCNVKINVYNRSPIAWDGVSMFILARDQQGSVVGQWRSIPFRFTDPGSGFSWTPEQPAETSCANISRSVVQFLGIYPAGKGQIQLEGSRVSSVLK